MNEALEMSEQSIEQTPDNPSYLDTMGWIYYQMGDYPQALEFLLRAQELSEENGSELLDHIGDVYWELGENLNARQYWKRAMEVDPDNETLREKIRQPESSSN